MAYKILVLGASYGSLLGTKLAMAGHDVTLVCRQSTAALINSDGTVVRIRLKDEDEHRTIRSGGLPGRVDAAAPERVNPAEYDLVALAMQEPQYCVHSIRTLLMRIASVGVPCLSIMNMPPAPFLRRLPGLDVARLAPAFTDAGIWDRFEPGLMTLCSPDPQAFRPADEPANVLHVGLPTNFKAAAFEDPEHTAMLREIEAGIEAATLDGKEVPVKLRVSDSLFVPLAKWSMLLTGNYRCILPGGTRSIRDAVHQDPDLSRAVYQHVDAIARRLGAEPESQVPFEKYARAAESLQKPSSAARAVAAGAPVIERVDRLVQLIGRQLGLESPAVDEIVATVDRALATNQVRVA
jgi:hypothetical protein